MTVVPIIQDGDPVLNQIAEPVKVDDIKSSKIKQIIENMKDTLAITKIGVAIAAPQIGISKRIFIVRGSIFHDNPEEKVQEDEIYINPVITKSSKKTKFMDEGCLSCENWYGEVKRNLNVSITYHDEHGQKKTRGAGGLLAHIFQHEIDHLDGILFNSKAQNLTELSDEEDDDEK